MPPVSDVCILLARCCRVTAGPAVIASRQDILDDLWRNPDFTMHLEALLPDLNPLEASRISVDRRRLPLQEVTWRLGELEYLVSCVTQLERSVYSGGGQCARLRMVYLA